jgi:hypothetical protein
MTRVENVFPKSYYCLLYMRTSNERRKGNPPTPKNLSLYTIPSASFEPSFMLRCISRIFVRDLTHHLPTSYQNTHATTSDVATLLPMFSSHSYHPTLFPHHDRFLTFLYNLRPRFSLMSDLLSHGSCTSSRIP